jgi:DNA-binding MarR family transcriptional regulator
MSRNCGATSAIPVGEDEAVPTSDDEPLLSDEQQETWFAYMRLLLRLPFEMNRQLQADSALSLPDFDVLNALADSPDQRCALSVLATRLGWERSRLSHHLLRMSNRGLVARAPSVQDGRVTEVVLSDAGRAQLHAATPSHAAFVRRLFFNGLDPALLAPLRVALDQIYEQVLAEGTLPRPAERQHHFPDLPPGA